MCETTSARPLVILGPTAGGKSALAVSLAQALGGQVIGADSMQVYRHLDAGTAKPPRAMRDAVPHHLIDLVEPSERFTVHDWLARADATIDMLQQQGSTPIIVGGTNLYLKALLEGLFDGPGRDEAFRASLEAMSEGELHQRLAQIDPDAAARIAPADRQRLTRALEVHHLTGQPISAMQTQWTQPPSPGATTQAYRHNPVLVGLRWPVDAINARINLRVKAMFFPEKVPEALAAEVCIGGRSLPDEVRDLVQRGLLGTAQTAQANEAIGYKQCLAVLDGQLSWDEAFEKTKIATRRFAKQQRTWLKRFRAVHWIDAADLLSEQVTQLALASLGLGSEA